ncbi:YaeQ family protein [Bordetella trematum]|uniref:YaeQ family protein n=1 Tax=Bordetella trematum TaxID=123899 RepID=UPI003D0A3B36
MVNLPAEQSRALGELAERGMQLNINISDGVVYVSAAKGEVTLEPQDWREARA